MNDGFALALKMLMPTVARHLLPILQQARPASGKLILTPKDTALIEVRNKKGSVTVILGTRETGKTVLAYRLAEFFGRPTLAVTPQEIPPSWIQRIKFEEVEAKVPAMSTLICDDLPSYLSNRDYTEEMARTMERIIPMVRHERQPPEFPVGEVHLIFCSQSSAQADKYILDCDMAFLKPLGLLYQDMERPNIRKIYRDFVDPYFYGKSDLWIKRHAYMWHRQYRGDFSIAKT